MILLESPYPIILVGIVIEAILAGLLIVCLVLIIVLANRKTETPVPKTPPTENRSN